MQDRGDTICGVKDEFESTTENTALKRAIIERIEREGAISFRDFMETVLYEPRLGYYASSRPKMGREGDYLTSPELSPLFGAMIGRQLREMWQVMDSPSRFDIVEAGAGTGSLARDILSWARRTAPDFADAAVYTIVEISEPLQEAQRARLEDDGLADRCEWRQAFPDAIVGCVLSNELLDALPVHRVAQSNGRLREVYVGWDGAAFREELRDPSAEVRRYFERLDVAPGDGCHAEVNLGAPEWVAQASRSLERGFLATFDYGYEAPELYAPWRTDGTLLCFYRHNPGTDPYARIGRQDITSHVDFTTVRRAGEEAGLSTLGLVTQSDFLCNLGIMEATRLPEGSTDMEEHFARRRAVMELLDPGGLGRIKVLIQARGVGTVPLQGLRSAE